jgi:branched-chain amino acid transport system substrate-binding protein
MGRSLVAAVRPEGWNMKSIRRFVVGAIVAFSFVACRGGSKPEPNPASSASAKPEASTIQVGLIASLTGKFSALGTEDKKAVELAIEQVNEKGGVLGKRVTLITRDDQTLPDKSVLAYNDLKAANVVAVIGSVFSNSALATVPFAQQDGIPYLSLTPADEQVEPIRPYVFVVPALAKAFAERYLEYMQSQKIKKIAVAHDTKGAYAVSGYNATKTLASKYGVELVRDEVFEMTTSDFSPLFTHVKGSGAQALLFWGTGPAGVTVTKQYAAANLKVPLFMTPSQASKLWLEPVGSAGEGVTVMSAIGVVGDALPEGPQKSVIDAMAVPFSKKFGYPPPQFAQDGYSACLLLFEAIKKANSTERAQVRAALETVSLWTPNGKYKYSATDHSGLKREFVSVNVVTSGRFVPTPWAKEQLLRTLSAE